MTMGHVCQHRGLGMSPLSLTPPTPGPPNSLWDLMARMGLTAPSPCNQGPHFTPKFSACEVVLPLL